MGSPYVGQPRVWLDQGRWLMLLGFLIVTATLTWMVRFGVDARFDPWRIEAIPRVNA